MTLFIAYLSKRPSTPFRHFRLLVCRHHTCHLRGWRRILSPRKQESLMQARGVKLQRVGMGGSYVDRKCKLATAILAQRNKNCMSATLHGARRQPYITLVLHLQGCVCSLRGRPPREISTFKAPSPFVCICGLAFAACGGRPQGRGGGVSSALHHRPGDSRRRMQSAIRKAGCSEITPCRLRITPYGSGPQGGSG